MMIGAGIVMSDKRENIYSVIIINSSEAKAKSIFVWNGT